MPLTFDALMGICKRHGLQVRWFDDAASASRGALIRSRFAAPGTIFVNKHLHNQEERLKYELAFFIGHKVLHNGDGVISPHTAMPMSEGDSANSTAGMGAQDVLYAWRDFECSFFAGALLCPRIPFRRFLTRESHSVAAGRKLGVTPALIMRRMTAVSPYRHWHFFDAYPPGVFTGRVPRQRHSAAVGQHESGVGPLSAVGGISAAAGATTGDLASP